MPSKITSEMTIQELRKVFAVHGLPEQLVSDNGPQFTSREFQEFMKANGISIVHEHPTYLHPMA